MIMVWWATRGDGDPRLAGLLDDTERQRWETFRRQEDRDRFLVGAALAKAAVGEATGTDPFTITLDRTCGQCGKPHGKPAAPGAELSISHSGDKIVVAVTETTPLGVDVEQIRSTRDLEGLGRYVLSETEHAVSEGDFFTIWTRKEAVTKATGDGLRVPFQEVIVSAADAPPRLLAWPYPEPPDTVWLRDLEAGPGYKAAVDVLGAVQAGLTQHDGTTLLNSLAR